MEPAPHSFLQDMIFGRGCDANAPGWTRCHLPTSARYRRLPSALGAFSFIGFGCLIIALFAAFIWALGGNDITSAFDAWRSKHSDAD
mmetsp:Transcript_72721/g.135889  ORF Transcript_72721/g.135889 Transcript_72721/m.135889 type:complete len:87 (+) Transcript_72721:59-319(+)